MVGGREKLYFKMPAAQYCVQMQKNIHNKQDQLTQFITIEKTKPKTKSKKFTNIFKILITIKSADL